MIVAAPERSSGRRVIAVIQARMGSTRLPRKMLMALGEWPLAEWVATRVGRATRLDSLIAAIPSAARDDALADLFKRLGVRVHRGSEEDVLGRCREAAELEGATHVVRVCADNPFVSPSALDALIAFFFRVRCDYAYNHVPRGNRWPDGLGAEIVRFDTLALLDEQAREPSQREHMFNYIWDEADRFVIRTFDPEDPALHHPELRLDVDTAGDLERLRVLGVDIGASASQLVARAREQG